MNSWYRSAVPWKANGIDPLKMASKLWNDTLVGKPRHPVGVAVHEPHQTPKPSAVDSKAP